MSDDKSSKAAQEYLAAVQKLVDSLGSKECDPVEGCMACDGCDEDEDENKSSVTVTKEALTTYSQGDVTVAVRGDLDGVNLVELTIGNFDCISMEGDDAHAFFSIMERVMQGVRRMA